MKKTLLFILILVLSNKETYTAQRCSVLNVQLPYNIRIERALFDRYSSRNMFLIGEGGNGVFVYDMLEKNVRQVYYSRIVTDSVVQTSMKRLRVELFYKRGSFAEIDFYTPSQMAEIEESPEQCYVKNGFLYFKDGKGDLKIAPFIGNPQICLVSPDSNLILFANETSGGYVASKANGEIAKIGYGSDFKFVNNFDIIFVKNSKIKEECTNSYIYYWLNSAVESLLIFTDKGGCIRYPDANKDSIVYVKNYTLYGCPLDLTGAVFSQDINK